jgi:hypothetical protein
MSWETGTKREFKFDPNFTENEGRWRLYDPKRIQKGSYFRRKSSTSGVSYVMGKAEGKNVIQAVRFDRDKFSEAEAAKWWSKNKGRGELVFSDERKKKAGMKQYDIPHLDILLYPAYMNNIVNELLKVAKVLVGVNVRDSEKFGKS